MLSRADVMMTPRTRTLLSSQPSMSKRRSRVRVLLLAATLLVFLLLVYIIATLRVDAFARLLSTAVAAPPRARADAAAVAPLSPPPRAPSLSPPPADPSEAVLASLPPGGVVFVTFSTSSMSPFMLNWAAHARAASLHPLLVGAFDDATAAAAARIQLPCVQLNAASVVGSGYVNTHSPAFKQMGAKKVAFLRRLLARGLRVALTDADALWLSDPRPYFESNGLDTADWLISSDCVDAEADERSGGGGICARLVNFNTGVMYVRPTPRSLAFADAWLDKLVEGAANNISWMRDQPAFNLVSREGALAEINPSRPAGHRAQLAAWNGKLSLGVLPPRLFAGGHTFFVQGLRAGALSVHPTYQFSDDPSFPFGKRSRLRQYGLWMAPEEAGYAAGRFLALRDDTAMPPPLSSLPPSNAAATAVLLKAHFDADVEWRGRVHIGLALARATNRALILPRSPCFCDRSWAPLAACRLPGAPATTLPFECPLDHIANTALWERSGVPFRAIGFQFPRSATVARIRIGAPVTGEVESQPRLFASSAPFAAAVPRPNATVGVPPDGTWDGALDPATRSDAEMADALSPWDAADVLYIGGSGAAASVSCLSSTTPSPRGHPVRTAPEFPGFAAYLLDQRVAFCSEADGPLQPPLPGGMVAALCGPDEGPTVGANPRPGFLGTIRGNASCPCEWGFAMPPMLRVVPGAACDSG